MSEGIVATPEHVSALDRGLAYGDGLFETFAVSKGWPCHWQAHMERLRQGCERLGIPSPDAETLRSEAHALCSGSEQAVLKLIVTRGLGGRGYRAPEPARPWHGFSLHPWPEYPEDYRKKGITARVCRSRLARNPALAGIKHLNRLEQVLARNEWVDEAQEGLMCDTEASVVEGTMSNLFLIDEAGLATPDLSLCGVAGVLRGRILDWAEDRGFACQVRSDISLDQVYAAEALFFTNSVIGIWPVRQLEEKSYNLDNELLLTLLSEDPAQCVD